MNNKRDIFILDCPEIKCPLVLIYVFKELSGYFERNNYNVNVINNINELHNNCIVFLGDTFNCTSPQTLLFNKAPDAIYIGWYWNYQKTDLLKYFIYTYENFLNIEYNQQRYLELKHIRETKYNCPLLLRANDDPNIIGSLERTPKIDYCYMGSPYELHLKPSNKYKGIFHTTYDHTKFLDYSTRRNIYLSSIFALGIQSKDNIGFKHTSQRIYEGLAYGCIVLTNSLPACEQCNNIPVYITSREDLENKIEYYINNPNLLKKKQQDGYDFIKKYGTNQNSINEYLNIINNDFKIII